MSSVQDRLMQTDDEAAAAQNTTFLGQKSTGLVAVIIIKGAPASSRL